MWPFFGTCGYCGGLKGGLWSDLPRISCTWQEPFPCAAEQVTILKFFQLVNSPSSLSFVFIMVKPKFPCGVCSKAVKNSDMSITCDDCMQWHHFECTGMSVFLFNLYVEHKDLRWSCCKCGLPDVNSSIFDSSISSISTDNTDDVPPQKKSKCLRIVTCNFQSVWNKQKVLQNFLHHNNVDALIGSESHLSCKIMNSEFLHKDYPMQG